MLGFTKQEQGIVLFLILSLLIGLGVKAYYRFYKGISIAEVDAEYIEKFEKRAEVLGSETATHGPVDHQKDERNSVGSGNLKPDSSQTYDKGILRTDSQNDEPHFLINVNTASADELERIPQIGAVLAGRIIEYRENHRFERIEELKKIRGIGEATLKKMAPYVSLK